MGGSARACRPIPPSPMKERLVGRLPTHGGAVIITLGGLLLGVLLGSIVIRLLDLQGGGALLLELAIVAGLTSAVWIALPDRWFTPWTGFFSPSDEPPWESPTDQRIREDREREEAEAARPRTRRDARAAGDPDDPRGDGGPPRT